MALIDRLKAGAKALFGKDGDNDKDMLGVIRSRTVSINTPEGQALKAAIENGDQRAMLRLAQQAMGHEPQTEEQAAAIGALGTDGTGNIIDWKVWETERRILLADAPDWSPCRFYRRINERQGAGVFGIAKGRFGIWREPYQVCEPDEFGAHESEDGIILPTLCDLSSGLAIALFADLPTAVMAAKVVEPLDWDKLPPADPDEASRLIWAEHFERMKRHLDFHGFGPDPDRHAHDNTGYQVNIILRSDDKLTEGKPGKVS